MTSTNTWIVAYATARRFLGIKYKVEVRHAILHCDSQDEAETLAVQNMLMNGGNPADIEDMSSEQIDMYDIAD